MHRILCVLLSGALLLTLLPGCTSREATSSQTASAPEALSPADPFYGEVLEKLGAKTTEDGLLVATPCSLLTVNWAEPEELAGYRYAHWYMEQLPDLPREEKRDRYAPPKGEIGWLIPAEELEQAAAERFGVSADHLRADTDCYREDLGGYQTGGVGLGDRPVLTVTAVHADGDREILTILEEWTVEQRSQTVELTIRRNGADWQAVSCLPAPLDKAALTALARQALLDYGAQEVDGVLRCRYASLLHHDGWANFAELATEDCWAWYHDLLQATLSTEEFQARYTSPNDFPGWFFPEEELESAVLRHFEIQPGYSAEQLHQDTRYYDAEYRGYQFPGGDGGGGFQPEVCIGTVTQEGDRVMVHTWLDYGGGQTGTEMVLTLRLTGLDPAYRFVSWLPENAVTSAGEAEDWLTEAMQLVQIEPSATGRFTDHGLGCPLLTAEPWDDPSELEPHALLDWYLRMGLPTTSRDDGVETRIAAADFEGALEQYFTPADPAFLREQADIYDADAGEYHAPLIGGRGMGSTFWAAPLSRDGDRQTVLISGASAGGPRTKGILTLQHRDDGSARLVSWDPDRSTMG